MEVVEECGPQWCNLPLPLLESSFKKLFPNSLASLASAQATCRAFSVAVIEVEWCCMEPPSLDCLLWWKLYSVSMY